MAEPVEKVGTKLEHAVAQTKADIEMIDVKCAGLQKTAEALRAEQVELKELLSQLEGSSVPQEPTL